MTCILYYEWTTVFDEFPRISCLQLTKRMILQDLLNSQMVKLIFNILDLCQILLWRWLSILGNEITMHYFLKHTIDMFLLISYCDSNFFKIRLLCTAAVFPKALFQYLLTQSCFALEEYSKFLLLWLSYTFYSKPFKELKI